METRNKENEKKADGMNCQQEAGAQLGSQPKSEAEDKKTSEKQQKKLKRYKMLSLALGVLLVFVLLNECGGCINGASRWSMYRDANRSYVERIDQAVVNAVREKEVVDGTKVDETKKHEMDSIGIFIKDGKSGYYNLNTDKIIIPALYTHAWFFSEGLAAVEQNGKIGFINLKGEMVIPQRFIYRTNADSQLAFQFGRCVVAGGDGHYGVIDQKGQWVAKPIYEHVTLTESGIFVTTSTSRQQLNLNGEVMQTDLIVRTESLKCEVQQEGKNEDGKLIYQNVELKTGYYVYYVHARGTNNDRCGLMDMNGNRLTAPEYSKISAINEQLFAFYLLDGETKIVKTAAELKRGVR